MLFRTAALAGLSVLLLSGCQSAKDRANCPVATVLANASSLTLFKPGLQDDPSGLLYTVQITGVTERCDFDKDEGTTDSNITVSFRATRTPTGDVGDYPVPYFIASVVDGATIQNKKILATTFAFQPGEAVTIFTANVPSFMVKFDNGKKPYQYGLIVGLQLTREQRDYNKKHGQ
ncbi:MAG: hypothetical protein WDN08_09425 [Rhizomicrobium sp.]